MKRSISFLCLLFILNLSATVINIPADQPTIQAGLNVAVEGDSVIVAEGTYYENINWPIVNGIKLIGVDKENCIIDGNRYGSVIHYEQWDVFHDSTNVIKNFTIQRGFSGNGGGIYLRSENQFILENLIVKDNICSFPTQQDIAADSRYSVEGGAGIHLDNDSSPFIRNVQIIQNYSVFEGGGLFIYFCSEPVLENVLIADNGSEVNGGGISCESGSSITFKNVTIANNDAAGSGGGIFIYGEFNTLVSAVNCIFWNNVPEEIYINPPYQRDNIISISYTDLLGGQQSITTNGNGSVNWLDGNIDSDPLFVDPANENYNLTEYSPCIDAGDPASPLDPDGTIADMGAFYYHQTSGIDNQQITDVIFHLNNYPNPFNPSTTIEFSIQNNSKVDLSIYNLKGQRVKSIPVILSDAQHCIEGDRNNYSVTWNGDNDSGVPVSSGLYLYKLNVNGKTEAVRKCLLLK